ncbi:MAG TPA: DUF3341 domain-containing protein [Polyangiales bacterium]|nr:DUF3341 domain-containing protein [Polyangiales bacterium]
MSKAVIGIVETRAQAESVVQALRATSIRGEDISVLMPDTGGSKDFAHEQHTKAPEGAAAGAGAGGVLGGTLGLLAGIGALAIPGFGPLIAAGPVLAALSGAAAGAAVGGLSGALVGLGIPELEAKAYEGKVKGGNILIAIHAADKDAQRAAKDALEAAGAKDVSSTSEASVPRDARA